MRFPLALAMVTSSSIMLALFVLVIFARPYTMITSPHIFVGLGLGIFLYWKGVKILKTNFGNTKTDLNKEENNNL